MVSQDRNSFGNGRLLGLQKELKLTSQEYGNCGQLFCKPVFLQPKMTL
jgi:hypothetical protein